jgi:glycosyltransferase involved in cell wall biosynthesis
MRLARKIIKPATMGKARTWVAKMSTSTEGGPTPQSPDGRSLSAGLFGINVVGPIRAELGLGEAARSTLRAAESASLPVAVIDYRTGCSSRHGEDVDESLLTHDRPHFANLFHINPDRLYVAYNILEPDFFRNRYNIAYCFWEQSELPDDWVPAFDLVDEIWVGSGFCQGVISRKTNRPVVRIPPNVKPEFSGNEDRKALGIPENGFVFLAMADFMSTPERKHPLGSLRAFIQVAFRLPRDVYFCLKTTNSSVRPDIEAEIQQYQKQYSSIIHIDGYLPRNQVNALIASCDCFVSLHRSEGFGLPLAEAMYFGKPVIATGWSGNMEFMTVNNSFPVRYDMVELEHDTGPFRRGLSWAQPDQEHAAWLMNRVVQRPDEARRLGQRARSDIRSNFSPEHIGRLMDERLKRIHRSFRR